MKLDLINIIKPTHICNLACEYCYNEDERGPIMGLDVLDRVIAETFNYYRKTGNFRHAVFMWHGGEPLVAGQDFFQHVVNLQTKYGEGVPFRNNIQTNGTLIDDQWAEFFAHAGFAVSLSLDGPQSVNDVSRKDHRGLGSFDRVMGAITTLRHHGFAPGVVLTASRRTVNHEEEIWKFFAENKLSFQIVELSKSGRAKDKFEDVGITPDEFTGIWKKLYDYWFSSENPGIDCASFRDRTKALLSGLPISCQSLYMCADANISIDPTGDVYACSTLSGNLDCCYGNVMDKSLEELMVSPVAAAFRTRKTDPDCAECKWFHVCHGGCLSRSLKYKGSIDVKDHYCQSLWATWDHIARRLEEQKIDIGSPHADHQLLDFGLAAEYRDRAKTPRRIIPVVFS
jgi:uncharacterized protein